MNKLRFFVSEYEDGSYEIETKHVHYAFRDDINIDNIEKWDLGETMYKIAKILEKENIQAYFVMN